MKKQLIALFLGIFVLAACNEVELTDGRIPAEYLDRARVVTGTYTGAMEGRAVTLTVSLNGDRMVMTATPDIVGSGCQSEIGLLRKVRVEKNGNDYTVKGATFNLNPNYCAGNVQGREIVFRVRERNNTIELQASIMEKTDWEQQCRVVCDGNPMNGGGCRQVCDYVPRTDYLTGNFKKI